MRKLKQCLQLVKLQRGNDSAALPLFYYLLRFLKRRS